jgi:hypothetical protein
VGEDRGGSGPDQECDGRRWTRIARPPCPPRHPPAQVSSARRPESSVSAGESSPVTESARRSRPGRRHRATTPQAARVAHADTADEEIELHLLAPGRVAHEPRDERPADLANPWLEVLDEVDPHVGLRDGGEPGTWRSRVEAMVTVEAQVLDVEGDVELTQSGRSIHRGELPSRWPGRGHLEAASLQASATRASTPVL